MRPFLLLAGMMLAAQPLCAEGLHGEKFKDVHESRIRAEDREAHSHYVQAGFYYLQSQYEDAIREYRETIRLNSRHAEAHYGLGLALNDTGRAQEAYGEWKEAVRLKPDFAEARYQWGEAFRRRGQLRHAERQFRYALKIKKDYFEAQRALGEIFAERGQEKEAEKFLHKAVELRPDDGETRERWALLSGKAVSPDNLVAVRLKAVEADPRDAEARYQLGMALKAKAFYRRKNPNAAVYAQAAEAWKEAVKLRADLVDAHRNLGDALVFQRHYADAAQAYQDAVYHSSGPETETRYKWVEVLLELGRFNDALEQAREIVKLDDADAIGHFLLGEALYRIQSVDEAVGEYREAIALKEYYARAKYRLGVVLSELDSDEAGEVLLSFLEAAPREMKKEMTHARSILRTLRKQEEEEPEF